MINTDVLLFLYKKLLFHVITLAHFVVVKHNMKFIFSKCASQNIR